MLHELWKDSGMRHDHFLIKRVTQSFLKIDRATILLDYGGSSCLKIIPYDYVHYLIAKEECYTMS